MSLRYRVRIVEAPETNRARARARAQRSGARARAQPSGARARARNRSCAPYLCV
jgi:hypothetical protein